MLDLKIRNNKLTLVLGMHRSGTSLLTRGLMSLGLDLGNNLMPPEADNPKGFWEDVDIVNLNETILNRFSNWSQITPKFESLQMLVPKEERLHAINLIDNKLNLNQPQAIKDPRISILLPFWQDIFSICGCTAYKIIAIRNPIDVALSLQKRNNFSIEHSLLLWLYYNLHCLREAQNEFLVVSYDKLLENPEYELHRIGAFLKITATNAQTHHFINDVIKIGLRHNKSTQTISDKDCEYNLEINSLYSLLLKESKNPFTSADDFRDAAASLFSLLASHNFFAKFQSKINVATQFHLIINGNTYNNTKTNHHNLDYIPPAATQDISFNFPATGNEIVRLEIPREPCIIKILQADAIFNNNTKQTVTVVSGSYFTDYNDIFAFNNLSPFLNFRLKNGTTALHIRYEILEKTHQTTRLLKAYEDTSNSKLQAISHTNNYAHLLICLHGSDFNSKDSLQEKVYLETSKITFDISEYTHKNIKEIRFNPSSQVATVTLHSCTFEYSRGVSYTLPSQCIHTTSIVTKDSKFIFLSNESCVLFDISEEKYIGLQKVIINLKYISLGFDEINNIFQDVNIFIKQQKSLLKSKEDVVSIQEKEIFNLNEKFAVNYLIPLHNERLKNIKRYRNRKIFRILYRCTLLLCNPSREITYYKMRNLIVSSGLFNEQYYLSQNPDLLPGCIDTFRHFYYKGWREGRNPSHQFNTNYYLSTYPDVKNSGINPLVHYLNNGKSENRFTSMLHAQIEIIKKSGLFDIEWYLEQYPLPDLIEPIEHYCTYGIEENKSPYPLFDTEFYLQQYCISEKKEQKLKTLIEINPLIHYILKGKSQNNLTYKFDRETIQSLLPKLNRKHIYDIIKESNLLQEDYYLSQLNERCEDTIAHYISIGFYLNLKPNPFFDNNFYTKQFPELKSYNIPPLLHYTLFGSKIGASPSVFFDPSFYNKYYTNVIDLGIDPLAHFLAWGWQEWRRPNKDFFTPYYVYKNIRTIDTIQSFVNSFDSYAKPSMDANTYSNYSTWYSKNSPVVSIILLNWNKSFLTIDCLISLWEFTSGYTYEIIIVDNGSTLSEKRELRAIIPYIKFIDLDVNRFYGEGNNIGIENSSGEYIVLLNNDTIVTKNWLTPLIDGLNSQPDIGVAGAKLLYPDGSIQEMGALVDAEGNIEQLGKHTPNFNHNDINEVDYCSGACLALRKHDFLQVLGFDYIWEPAYYEDNDLCWKIKTLNKKVIVVPESEIYHLEHVSISNQQELNFSKIIDQNKKKFLARWKEYIINKHNVPNLVLEAVPVTKQTAHNKENALIYTPFPILLGGGERYLLTIAEYLQSNYNVFLVVPELYSKLRILTIGRDLGLDLHDLHILKFEQTQNSQIEFSLSMVMGNEILPRIPAIAKYNIFHCQFPFKYHFEEYGFQQTNVQYYDHYNCILVNSEFTKFNIQKQQKEYSLNKKPIYIAYPPVGEFETGDDLLNLKENTKILSIGRFFVGGHNKKHDFLIKAFKSLVANYGYKDAQLNLVGGTHTESVHRKYVEELQELATGYNIVFHFDLSNEGVTKLLKFSSIYWHATGIDVDPVDYPEAMEHFGITPVEAMKAACIPLVPNKGGVCEIVRGCSTQMLTYRNEKELIDTTNKLLNLSKSDLHNLRKDILERSNLFGKDRFVHQLQDVIETVCESRTTTC